MLTEKFEANNFIVEQGSSMTPDILKIAITLRESNKNTTLIVDGKDNIIYYLLIYV